MQPGERNGGQEQGVLGDSRNGGSLSQRGAVGLRLQLMGSVCQTSPSQIAPCLLQQGVSSSGGFLQELSSQTFTFA